MLKEKTKLLRHEKRLLDRLKTSNFYKDISDFIHYIFSFKKIFLTLAKSKFWKTIAITSITIFSLFWRKIAYIDDLIVHKKSRGKWVWKKLFTKTIDKLKKEKTDYAILLSRDNRKVSHKMYRKFWFVVVSFWVGIFAYKSLKKKNKRSIFNKKDYENIIN